MNGLRKVVGHFIAMMMLVTYAVPGMPAQPQKIFALAMSSVAADGTVSATITNVSPTGNSAINSIIIVRPSNATIVTSPLPIATAIEDTGDTLASFAIDPATGNLKVNGFKGLLPQDQTGPHSITVTFKIQPATVGAWSCLASLSWFANAYAGNSWNGDTFAIQPPGTTSVPSPITSTVCNYAISASPTQVTAGTSTDVSFTFTSGAPTGGPVIDTLKLNGAVSGVTISNPVLVSGGLGTTVGLSGPSTNPVITVSNASLAGGGALTVKVTLIVGTSCSTTPLSVLWTSSATSAAATFVRSGNEPTTAINANNCQYSVTTTPSSVNAGASTPVAFTFTNLGGTGTPAIDTLTLSNPPPGSTISSVSLPSGTTSSAITPTTTSVTISNISPPIAAGGSRVVTVTLAAAPSCTGTGATSWTSSASSGLIAFGLFGSNPQTSIAAQSCTLGFLSQPQEGTVDTPLDPVTVTLNGGSGSGTVTITSNCALDGGSVSAPASGGSVTFSNLVFTAPGSNCTLTASSPGYTSVTSGPFSVFKGVLNCQPTSPFTFNGSDPSATDITRPGYAVGQRGKFNKDGTPCVAVDYTFLNEIITKNKVTLTWDTIPITGQPGAAFLYTVTWKPEWVDMSSGMPKGNKTYVQWFVDGTLTPPEAVQGRACLAWNPTAPPGSLDANYDPQAVLSYLPAPYGTLAAGINDVATGITVNLLVPAANLPPVPFPIQIGMERLTVTSTGTGSNWVVVRGGLLVNGTPVGPHDQNASVMSNPLPLDQNGMQMRMCIAEEGWSNVPAGTVYSPYSDCTLPPPSGGPMSCVMYTTTFYDIGDGVGVRSP